MATIGVGSGNYIRPQGKSFIKRWLVDTSQTVRIGDPLVLSTDSGEENRVKVSGADPTTDRGFVGFAAEAITTTATHSATADRILVWIPTADNRFVVHYADAQAPALSDIGVEYGIVNDSTNNIWRLDDTETTAKIFRVLELLDGTDTNGRAVVHVLAPERLYFD